MLEGVNTEYLARHRARFRKNEQDGNLLLGRQVKLRAGGVMELEEDEWGPVSDVRVEEFSGVDLGQILAISAKNVE